MNLKQMLFLAVCSISLYSIECTTEYNRNGCQELSFDIGDTMSVLQYKVLYDRDQDGVADNVDQCLKSPPSAKVDENGCQKDKDKDKDGVVDSLDKCPATPLNTSVDKNGCCLDEDRDGVLDHKDRCLNTPHNVKVDKNGCCYDRDRDGVLDYKDKCLDTPFKDKVDIDGCSHIMTLKLNFAIAKYDILESSIHIIKKFAVFLMQNPHYNLHIVGHTDSKNKSGNNMTLSFNRANTVKTMLVELGVDGDRISTQGVGHSQPIATNDTAEGRAKNRRIEVTLSRKDK